MPQCHKLFPPKNLAGNSINWCNRIFSAPHELLPNTCRHIHRRWLSPLALMVSNFSENIAEWHHFGRANIWRCHSLQLAHLQFNGVNGTTTTTITIAQHMNSRVCVSVSCKGCWRLVSMLLATTRLYVYMCEGRVCGCARWWLHWICIFDMSVRSANICRACGVHYETLTLPITQSHTHTQTLIHTHAHGRACSSIDTYSFKCMVQLCQCHKLSRQHATPSTRTIACRNTLLLHCLAAFLPLRRSRGRAALRWKTVQHASVNDFPFAFFMWQMNECGWLHATQNVNGWLWYLYSMLLNCIVTVPVVIVITNCRCVCCCCVSLCVFLVAADVH